MRTHIFCEYLCENGKFQATIFACSYGAPMEFFDLKKRLKSRDTVPLRRLTFLEKSF